MQSLSTIALISVHSDPAGEIGSQNTYVRQLGEALSRLGWQVDMFTRKTDLGQKNIIQHNPRCRTIRLKAGAKQFIPEQYLVDCLPTFLQQLLQFQRENNIQYKLIHTNYWLSAWVGVKLKKVQSLKHIHTFHTLGAVKYANDSDVCNLTKNRLRIEKTCLKTADLNIATCPQQRNYLRELVSDKGYVEIIPCGTDPNLFGSISQYEARRKLGIESDLFNILYVGKFNRRQGVETLIKAISKPQLRSLDNIRLTIVNNSSKPSLLLMKRIEKLVSDSKIDRLTTFVKEISREKLAAYYAAADICVVPSQYSPSGMVAMEAMASGTPVIASDVGGLKYVVEQEKSGLLFPSQNSFLLAQAISRLMDNAQLRLKMSVLARERVFELFTWDDVASQLSELYTEQIRQQNVEQLDKSLQDSVMVVGV